MIAPFTATAPDGTIVEVYVISGGATSLRLVHPGGDDTVVDFTETASALWSEVEAARRAAA